MDWVGAADRAGLQMLLIRYASKSRRALRKNKPLIPVLVSRAPMPRPDQLPESLQDFAYRNAVFVDLAKTSTCTFPG